MRSRFLLTVAALSFLAGLLRPVPGHAEEPETGPKAGHCACSEGKACWHYLRSPLRPPEDPCRCGLCAVGGNCSSKERPDGWGADCMGSQKEACFWKRHSASWGITCSQCYADKDCGVCDGSLPGTDPAAAATLRKQANLEGDGPKRRVFVGWSRHFYVATDIPRLKLLVQGGAPRVADQHEIVHLFLERAEKAYDDWVAVWGEDVRLDKPMGIYLAERNSKKDAWQAAYFGNAKTNMLYGGAPNVRVGGGFCFNGFAVSTDDEGSDRDLHAHVRHMIGHILFSCWHGVTGMQKNCPKWAFVGAADWLCRIDPLFKDWTTFCHDEGNGATGSGKDWDKKARVVAAAKHEPIEKLFGVPSLSQLTYDDHVRSWSYMDLMLREDRERWLECLRGIREGQEHAQAFQRGLAMTPAEFDQRWQDRLTGKRKTMADVAKDSRVPARQGPDVALLKRIEAEQDPTTLAALLRTIDVVTDVKTAETAISRFKFDSDLVRETLVIVLSKTTDPAVIAYLRSTGLSVRDSMVRGYVARVLGVLKDAGARVALEDVLKDSHWLARANAAWALGQIADPAALPALLAAADDTNDKAWIAKTDALATFGQAASKATVGVAARLKDTYWQVRLTACRALATLGDADAVEPLIERLETESGRLAREVLHALRSVTHEAYGPSGTTWRDWWKRQKPRGIPPPSNDPPPDSRYVQPKKPPIDEPTYYGRRIFSQSILFVLDISKSMDTFIQVSPESAEKFGGLVSGPRIAVAKAAVVKAIAKLDTRARFNVVFFSTKVRTWQNGLVFAAQGAKDGATSAVNSVGLEDETNVYGALRAALGIMDKATMAADLDPIPDTIYFLTDGTPTRGEITETDALLSWVKDVNRFAKVDLHVIAMGNTGVDLPFLEALATQNGGEFVHIPDR